MAPRIRYGTKELAFGLDGPSLYNLAPAELSDHCVGDVAAEPAFSMFPGVNPAPRTLLSMAMQHLRVACYQDPQTSLCRGAADWMRLCIRPRRPGRYKCRVVQPANRRWPSGLLPDSDRVDRKAHKPAPVFHGGTGLTAARLHHHARAAPLATRRRIGVRHTLDDVLPLFG